MATDVVEKIIKKIRKYDVASEIFVVKEERDTFTYSCREITVPSDYKTPNGSLCKMRAMHYGIEEMHRMGYGKETYIVHLDDDSIVDKPYLEFVTNVYVPISERARSTNRHGYLRERSRLR